MGIIRKCLSDVLGICGWIRNKTEEIELVYANLTEDLSVGVAMQ